MEGLSTNSCRISKGLKKKCLLCSIKYVSMKKCCCIYIYIYIYIYTLSLILSTYWVRVFANGPGDLGSIPGRVIPKTQKMVLDASLLNTRHHKVRIKGKVEQSREGVAPSPTPWCSSYRKGSLRVTLDYGRQLYLLLLYKYAKLPSYNKYTLKNLYNICKRDSRNLYSLS